MRNKIFFMIGAPLFAISIISISLFFISDSNPNNSPSALSDCKNYIFNSQDAITLLFFATESETKKYSDHLLSVSPFNENKKMFNIYYINDYQPSCENYKGIAILCYSKDLIKRASSCPSDYIFVVKKESANLRSSSYLNVMSINSVHPLSVLTHEFGHAFANFAEEYTPAKLPRGSTNCVSSCDEFSGETDGCFKGCSKEDYQRSIEEGVMRTLSTDNFGKLNTKFLENRIEEEEVRKQRNPITGKAISSEQTSECAEQNYLLIEGKYDTEKNTLSFEDKTTEIGCAGGNGYGEFSLNIKNSLGDEIKNDKFNPEFIFTDEPKEDLYLKGETYESDRPFAIRLPIIPEAENLEISHNDQITTISLKDVGARACKI